jgi:cation:H+ antiporter
MMFINLIIFLFALFVVIRSADYCVKFATRIAHIFKLSEFLISFFIVAIISTFPEGTISIISAINNVPQFGAGTLLGSNVADLTLVFGIVALFSTSGIIVRSTLIKKDTLYLLLLAVPVILGLDGHFSRIDGGVLVAVGLFFFYTISIEGKMFRIHKEDLLNKTVYKNIAYLVISLLLLILGAHYTINYGIAFAHDIGLPELFISLTFVAIGTCLPELMFSIKAIRSNHNELVMGDILGTVITDATLILGIVALIAPFTIERTIIYVTGFYMVIAALLIVIFIKTGRMLTKKEGIFLLFFYIAYLLVEFAVN